MTAAQTPAAERWIRQHVHVLVHLPGRGYRSEVKHLACRAEVPLIVDVDEHTGRTWHAHGSRA